MKNSSYCKILGLSVLFLMICVSFSSAVSNDTQTIKVDGKNNIFQKHKFNLNTDFQGHIFFPPEYSEFSYLINSDGETIHSWKSDYKPGLAAYLLENGNIIRNCVYVVNPRFMSGGVTGRVEQINWSGELGWSFDYSNDKKCLHHDMEILPNGNILMIAWEYKSKWQAMWVGRNPNYISLNQVWPDHIIEVEKTGPNGGRIVWEWHVWDHLIQDYSKYRYNYGVVEDHPELIDINYGGSATDWLHCNSIDYNEEFDQILISVNHFNEIWIIDHSTTTEEAAGHTGGNSGKGGDLLYRWGNPEAYRAGTIEDKKFFDQHDAQWIPFDYPGEGNILVFNNGVDRPDGSYSSIEELEPPVNDSGFYYLDPNESYGPLEPVWKYTAENHSDFYSSSLSGVQRMPNGNTLICNGNAGEFFEVTPNKEIIWDYLNPYPNSLLNNVFKIQYIPVQEEPEDPNLECYGSLNWNDIKTGATVYGSFKIENIGGNNSMLNWKIDSYPNWGTWSFDTEFGEGLTPEDGEITINVTVVAPTEKNKIFKGSLRIENQNNTNDFDVVSINLNTQRERSFEKIVSKNLFRSKLLFLIFNFMFLMR